MMNERSKEIMDQTNSNSYAINLKKWYAVMQKYEEGTFLYHTTMPTDGLMAFAKNINEMKTIGFEKLEK